MEGKEMKRIVLLVIAALGIPILSPISAHADGIVLTRISGTSSGGDGVLVIEHPTNIICNTPPSVDTGKTRCDFQIRTRVESGSLSSVINVDPVDQNGSKLGYLATSLMYQDTNWKTMNVTVSVDKNTKLTFVLKAGPLMTATATSQSFSSFTLAGANIKPFSLVPSFPKTVKNFKGENVNIEGLVFPQAIQTGIDAVDMGWGTAIASKSPVMLFAYPTVMAASKKCQVIPFKVTALNPSTLQPIVTQYAVFKAEVWSQNGQLLSSGTLGTPSTPWSKVSSVSTLSLTACGKSPQDLKSVTLIVTAGQSFIGSFLIREYRSKLVFK